MSPLDTTAVTAPSSSANHPPAQNEPQLSTPVVNRHKKRKWPWIVGLILLAGAAVIGIPWISSALTTVSTDDAYVNGHVTFVAPRVAGQVARVLVDDNNVVRKGDLLVELDP